MGLWGFGGSAHPTADSVVAGVWLPDIPALNYESELFHERQLSQPTRVRTASSSCGWPSGSTSELPPMPMRWPTPTAPWPI